MRKAFPWQIAFSATSITFLSDYVCVSFKTSQIAEALINPTGMWNHLCTVAFSVSAEVPLKAALTQNLGASNFREGDPRTHDERTGTEESLQHTCRIRLFLKLIGACFGWRLSEIQVSWLTSGQRSRSVSTSHPAILLQHYLKTLPGTLTFRHSLMLSTGGGRMCPTIRKSHLFLSGSHLQKTTKERKALTKPSTWNRIWAGWRNALVFPKYTL